MQSQQTAKEAEMTIQEPRLGQTGKDLRGDLRIDPNV
jgi:hypothetical protein